MSIARDRTREGGSYILEFVLFRLLLSEYLYQIMRYFPYCLLGQVGVATDGVCASFGSFLPSFKGWVPERNMADLFAALCAPQKATGGGSRPPQNTVWDCAQCSNGRSKTSAEVQVWITH